MLILRLLNYTQVYNQWLNAGADKASAVELTIQQVDAFEEIVESDEAWKKLMEISARGRNQDSWLAADWPSGFDELLLCVPLCKLVDWDCKNCTIGRRQENNSCANDYSVFGYIGLMVKNGARAELKKHLKDVRKMLKNENLFWNIHKGGLEKTGL